MRLIHTSDWQIGKAIRLADEATREVLRDERLEAIRSRPRPRRCGRVSCRGGATRITSTSGDREGNPPRCSAWLRGAGGGVTQEGVQERFAAMAAGVSDRLWSMEDVVALVDAVEGPAKKRGPYKPRVVNAA